jgi:hypothetical protein
MNWPVLDEKGSILAIVHHVVDVTPDILATQAASRDILFRRAQEACDEAERLHRETRGIVDLMIGRP